MTNSQDEQGRPNCDACKFKIPGKHLGYLGMDGCGKGHNVVFTLCVVECKDFKPKIVYCKEVKPDEKS